MNGERVATWALPARSAQQLTYTEEWLRSGDARPLSLSMPIGPVGTVYRGELVERFFENLLPDSRSIRERLRRRFSLPSSSAFDLLGEVGRDCVGAIQLLPMDEAPVNVRSVRSEPLSARAIERLLRRVLSPAPLDPEEHADAFRISLAGAQEKTALLRVGKRWMQPIGATPSTHILKLPIGEAPMVDPSSSVENEWLCSRILEAYGVPVAPCWMERFGEQRVLVVERFDRRRSADGSWILRLPQEDFCQATGTAREQKYEADGGPGIRKVMDILLGSARAEEDRLDFFRTQIVFWLLCAIDGHAKNFSLFNEAGGRFRLTPRYDVLSAFPSLGRRSNQISPHKVKMAMAIEGRSRHYAWRSIERRHWEETARRCGIGAYWPRVVDDLLDRTPAVLDTQRDQLPDDFPAQIAGPILEGLEKSAAKLRPRGF